MSPGKQAVEVPEGRRRGGRPLDVSRDLALRQAALTLLAEVGYDRLTMEAVATRAGAAKTTIYRRWQTKAALVVDALNGLKGDHEAPDTGSLREDLRALAAAMVGAESKFGALTIGIVNALSHDAELRRVFDTKFVAPRMAAFRVVFERAIARGEMPADRDLDLLARLLPALGLQRLLTTGELPDARWVRHVMDDIVYALATHDADTASTVANDTTEGNAA